MRCLKSLQTMQSYKDFTKHFGISLFDKTFQDFLTNIFSDLTEYNILENDYITSAKGGMELGFTNNEAVYDDEESVVFEKGNPIFSHFILYPKSLTVIDYLPFDVDFDDNRVEIIRKEGNPSQTKVGYADFLKKDFLVDNYKEGNIVVTFDYDAKRQTVNFIQIRDNNLCDHIKM